MEFKRLHEEIVFKFKNLMENVKLCERFILKKRLGGGSFGEIYLSEDTQTKRKVAIKLENSRILIPQLELEAQIYRYLSTSVNLNLNSSAVTLKTPTVNSSSYTYMNQNIEIPGFYYYGADLSHNFNVLAIDVLGRSLEDLLDDNDAPFSLKTVLMLVDQMISCVEFVHRHGYIHRDIKPDNFMLALKSNVNNFSAVRFNNNGDENISKKKNYSNKINIIDFGLSKRYRDAKTGAHVPYKKKKTMTGTARYASLSAMVGNEQSRRDDLESLGYVFVYLLKGRLPWQGLPAEDHKERLRKIFECKRKTPIDELCKGIPQEFATYLKKVRKLKFDEEPKYSEYRQMFRDLFIADGFTYDYKYDWNDPKEEIALASFSTSTTKINLNDPNYRNLPKVTPNIPSNIKDPNNQNNVNTKTITFNQSQIPNSNQHQIQVHSSNPNQNPITVQNSNQNENKLQPHVEKVNMYPIKQPNEPPPIRLSHRRSRRARNKKNNQNANNTSTNNLVQSNVNLNITHPLNVTTQSNAANAATPVAPTSSQPFQTLHSHVQPPPRRVNNWGISPRRENIKLSNTAGAMPRLVGSNTNVTNMFNASTTNTNQAPLNLTSVLPKINKLQVQ